MTIHPSPGTAFPLPSIDLDEHEYQPQLSSCTKKTILVAGSGVLRKVLGRQQLIGAKRHGQELLESHDRVFAELVVHQDGSAGLLKAVRVSQRQALHSSNETGTPSPKHLHRRTHG